MISKLQAFWIYKMYLYHIRQSLMHLALRKVQNMTGATKQRCHVWSWRTFLWKKLHWFQHAYNSKKKQLAKTYNYVPKTFLNKDCSAYQMAHFTEGMALGPKVRGPPPPPSPNRPTEKIVEMTNVKNVIFGSLAKP